MHVSSRTCGNLDLQHLNTVYETILGNLPKLEHLKLWIETLDTNTEESLNDIHKQAIQSAITIQDHRALKSVELKVYAFAAHTDGSPYYISDMFIISFVKDASNFLISVPKLDRVSGVMIEFYLDEMNDL